MEKIILMLVFLTSLASYGDVQVDCKQGKLKRWEILYCERERSENIELEYFRLYDDLLNQLTIKKKEISLTNFSPSVDDAIKKAKESHRLWISLIAVDCDLWAYSPLNSGSRNPDYEGCITERYIQRIQKLKIIREAWLQ